MGRPLCRRVDPDGEIHPAATRSARAAGLLRAGRFRGEHGSALKSSLSEPLVKQYLGVGGGCGDAQGQVLNRRLAVRWVIVNSVARALAARLAEPGSNRRCRKISFQPGSSCPACSSPGAVLMFPEPTYMAMNFSQRALRTRRSCVEESVKYQSSGPG